MDTSAPAYRPALPEMDSAAVNPQILTLMKHCWTEEPSDRPSFDDIAKTLKSINKGKLALRRLLFSLSLFTCQSCLIAGNIKFEAFGLLLYVYLW